MNFLTFMHGSGAPDIRFGSLPPRSLPPMRKALLPMLVSLALCGAATTAMVMSSAHAAPEPHKPLMVAAANTPDMQLAANDAPDGPPPPRDLRRPGPTPADFAARMKQMCNDGY